jgi:hypothetical protein
MTKSEQVSKSHFRDNNHNKNKFLNNNHNKFLIIEDVDEVVEVVILMDKFPNNHNKFPIIEDVVEVVIINNHNKFHNHNKNNKVMFLIIEDVVVVVIPIKDRFIKMFMFLNIHIEDKFPNNNHNKDRFIKMFMFLIIIEGAVEAVILMDKFKKFLITTSERSV